MRTITLTKGQIALVDDEDYEWLSQYDWHAVPWKDGYYAYYSKDGKRGRMQRLILGCTKGDGVFVDHEDKNTLNNQRHNLRKCTPSQNNMNRKISHNNTSGVKGVSWYRPLDKWVAKIGVNNRRLTLGYFESFDEAVVARKAAEILHFGEFVSK